MARLLYRIGRFAARRRRAVLAAWLVALVGLGGAALGLSGTMTDSFSIPGTPAQKAMDQLAAKMPSAGGATGRIVFAAPQGHEITETGYQQAISSMLAETSELPSVVGVVDPATAKAISADGRVAMAQVTFTGQITEIPESTQDSIADLADRASVDGMTVDLSGAAIKQMPAIGSTEGIGVIVALVVLLLTFGSVVAAGLPLLTALIGVGVGMAGILLVSGFVQMSSTAPILALMLGLAVGIDYALFIVNRHRRQLREGMDVQESIARAVGTAGSAVVFAGLTVVIALAALSVVGIPFLTIMGIAAAATVVMAVLIAITLVPALLGFAGLRALRRADRPGAAGGRHRRRGDGAPEARDSGSGAAAGSAQAAENGNRWSRLVTRRPVAMLVSGVLVLGVLAVPAFSLRLGLPDDGTAAPSTTQRQAYDEIASSFGPGANGPLIVTVAPDDPAALKPAMGATVAAVSRMPGVVNAAPAGASSDGTLGAIQVIPSTGPGDGATDQLVHTIRDAATGLESSAHAEISVTGQTALQIDVSEKLSQALPIYLAIVIGLALILLLVVFRSLLIPLKAAAGFLLTIAVSFGMVVAVYQWGWLGGLFGVDTPAPVISFLPILLIGVLFGLAMDYEVFLVSGMRESWAHEGSKVGTRGSAVASVRQGFSAGSRVVTAAAIIMASVFGGFIMAPDSIIASIGFALAAGVLVDAFVVRMTLVPAVMAMLGRHAWYLPRWLDRILPNVDIEGAALTEAEPAKRELAGV